MKRLVIVGGGSPQWTPLLAADIASTPVLHGSEIVLDDIDGARLARLAKYVVGVSDALNARLVVRAGTDLAEAVIGADFVIVSISTGGLDAMERDLAFASRYGFEMPVGDTIGPAGIARAMRNIPVLAQIAHTVETIAPNAWFVNVFRQCRRIEDDTRSC